MQFKIAAVSPQSPDAKLFVLSLFALLIAESLFLVWLIANLKYCLRSYGRLSRFLLISLVLSPVYVLTVYLACSWLLFETSLSFFSAAELFDLVGSLDLSNALRASSSRDLLIGAAALLFGLPLLWLMCRLVQPSTKKFRLLESMFFFTLFACFAFGAKYQLLSHSRLAEMRPVYQNLFSPRFSMFWAKLHLGGGSVDYQKVKLELNEASSLDQYVATVDRATFKRKNVLLVYVEAMRANLPAEAKPFISQLASKGVSFKNAFANSPETAYSQAALLSGQHPLRFPTRDYYRDVTYPHATLHDIFHHLDYRTANLTFEWKASKKLGDRRSIDLDVDSQYELPAGSEKFLPDAYRGASNLHSVPTAYLDRLHVEVLKEWLAEGSAEKPFFASLYLYSSHFPYNVVDDVMQSEKFTPNILSSSASFFDYSPELVPVMWNRYLTNILYLDTLMQELHEHLEALGVLDNTLIVFTGDHGEAFHEHGEVTHSKFMWNEILRVPLIFRGADEYRSCNEEQLASHLEVAPTILKVLGLPRYDGFQSSSVLCRGKEGEKTAAPTVYGVLQGLRSDSYLIEWPWKLLSSNSNSEYMLFNLASDPAEQDNLASKNVNKLGDLQEKLANFRDRQFSYYLEDEQKRNLYFPPLFEALD